MYSTDKVHTCSSRYAFNGVIKRYRGVVVTMKKQEEKKDLHFSFVEVPYAGHGGVKAARI